MCSQKEYLVSFCNKITLDSLIISKDCNKRCFCPEFSSVDNYILTTVLKGLSLGEFVKESNKIILLIDLYQVGLTNVWKIAS